MTNSIINIPSNGKRWQKLPLALPLVCLALAQSPASAHSPNDSAANSMASKIRQSALIAYGQVVDIQYRNSEPTKIQPQGVPHTFVTYQLQEVLRGEVADKFLTLRIPGGADGKGGVYMDSSAPVFALGQTDFLFVKGGEPKGCPLVDCAEGRFRVFENQVFNGWGVPVVAASRTLQIGGKPRFDLNVMELPRPTFQTLAARPDVKADLERVMKETGLGLAELEKKYDLEAPKTTVVNVGYQASPQRGDGSDFKPALPIKKFAPALTPVGFSEAVLTLSKAIGAPTTKVVMPDPKARFFVPDPRAVAAPTKVPPKLDISEEERLDSIK